MLRSAYTFPKDQIIPVQANLLSSKELVVESESSAEVALELYLQSKADFGDCMHIALVHAAEEAPLSTFDKAASMCKALN